MIKCGNGHQHSTVAEVKTCYGQGPSKAMVDQMTRHAQLATDKQVKYAIDLLGKRNRQLASGTLEQLTKPNISGLIDYLNGKRPSSPVMLVAAELPSLDKDWSRDSVRNGSREPYPDVPAGHYATPSATGNNDLDFWRVDRPTKGTWAGRTFVKRVIGGRPNSPVRGATARAALELILKGDPEESARLYGRTIGRCWKCNRHLTDETSRALGIGPDCRSKA